MGISFGSINTGLPKDIVQQIVQAERIPIQQMEERKAKIAEKKNLVGQLTTLLEGLRGEIFKNKGMRSLRELKISGTNEQVAVTADKNIANPGDYQLEVLELAKNSTVITNGIESKDIYLGVGYISYELPDGEVKEIFVDQEHGTLDGIAKLINSNPESGMKATVIQDQKADEDEQWKLIISLPDTGSHSKATFPDLYFVDGDEDLYFEEERPAQNAKIKLDGFEMEVPSNKLTELIPGVTIDLKKAKPGEEISIGIKEDVQAISTKIDSMVEAINKVLKFIIDQNSLDEKSDTSKTLGGDSTLQTIESRLRSALFMPIHTEKGNFRMSDLGLTFQRSGLLKLDGDKFQQVLNKDYNLVAQALNGVYSKEGKTDGFIDNLEKNINLMLSQPNGSLVTRKNGLQSNIDQIDRQIETRQRMIERKEEVLKTKFGRLEESMAKIRAQGAGLAGMAQGMNPVQQLG